MTLISLRSLGKSIALFLVIGIGKFLVSKQATPWLDYELRAN